MVPSGVSTNATASCANCLLVVVVLVTKADRRRRACCAAAPPSPTDIQNGQSTAVAPPPASSSTRCWVAVSSLASSAGSMLTSTARKSLPELEARAGRRLDQAVEHQPAQHRAAVVAQRHQHRLAAAEQRVQLAPAVPAASVNASPAGTRSPRCSMTSMSCSAASGCSLPCGNTIFGFSARAAPRRRATAASAAADANVRTRRASLGRSRRQRAGRDRVHRPVDRDVRDALALVHPAVAVQVGVALLAATWAGG